MGVLKNNTRSTVRSERRFCWIEVQSEKTQTEEEQQKQLLVVGAGVGEFQETVVLGFWQRVVAVVLLPLTPAVGLSIASD